MAAVLCLSRVCQALPVRAGTALRQASAGLLECMQPKRSVHGLRAMAGQAKNVLVQARQMAVAQLAIT